MKFTIAATTLALAASASALTINPLMARDAACIPRSTVGDRFFVGKANTKDACNDMLSTCSQYPQAKKSCMGSPDRKVVSFSCEAPEDGEQVDFSRWVAGEVNKKMPQDSKIGLLVNSNGHCAVLPGVAGNKCAQYDFDTKELRICGTATTGRPASSNCIPKAQATREFYAKGAGDWVAQCNDYKGRCAALKMYGPVLANRCDHVDSSEAMLVKAACIVKQNDKEYAYTFNVAHQAGLRLSVPDAPNCGQKMAGGRCATENFGTSIRPICHV